MIQKIHTDFINSAAEILKNDKRLAGAAVGGSYITRDMDEYSDIDFVIAVNSADYEIVMQERKEIVERLGNLLVAFTGEHVGEPRLLICLYGPPLLHVDIKFVSMDDYAARIEDPIVLWERDGALTNAMKRKDAVFPMPDLQWIEDRFWIWVHYAGTKIGRRELFEAIEFISFLRQNVIGPLMLMKNNKLPRGVRKIETDASSDLPILIESVASHSAESCKNAVKVLIDLYRELRDYHKEESLIIRNEAEMQSVKYLDDIPVD